MIAHVLGIDEFHTAELRTVGDAQEALRVAREIGASL
jgi:hypothetical protein